MKRQLVYFLKLLGFVSLTAYLSSSGVLNAQSNSKSVEITNQDGRSTIIYEESHALVIWAGNYQHWNRLNNVEAESKQVVNVLEKQGFKVTTVGNPTGNDLRVGIKNFIDKYGYNPNNRLVIFFTGHGHTRNQTKGYLVPVDAPDPYIDEQGFLKHAFSMQWMISWAREIEAKHALFVFDSCFSGTIFKTKALPNQADEYIHDVMDKPVRQFIAAGDADQEVPAKSIFTPLFLEGLEGNADYTRDGYVTGSELGLYITQTLRIYTSDQTPQYGKIRDVELDQGDIVFHSQLVSSNLPVQIPETIPSEIDSKGSLNPISNPDLDSLGNLPSNSSNQTTNASIKKLDVSFAEVNNENEYSGNYLVSNIIDGSNESYWCTKSGSIFDVALDFYFNEPKSLNQINIYSPVNETNSTQPEKVELIFFNDSGNEIMSQTITTRGSSDQWQEYKLERVDNVSSVKMELGEPKDNTASYLTINEIRFYGYE